MKSVSYNKVDTNTKERMWLYLRGKRAERGFCHLIYCCIINIMSVFCFQGWANYKLRKENDFCKNQEILIPRNQETGENPTQKYKVWGLFCLEMLFGCCLLWSSLDFLLIILFSHLRCLYCKELWGLSLKMFVFLLHPLYL